MMVAKENQKDKLISWKEIADYLDSRVRTCQRWEKEFGLPVHRFIDSSKSRVFAYKKELDKWLQSRPKDNKKNKLKFLLFLIPAAALFGLYFLFFKPPSPSQPHDFTIQDSELVILNKKKKELWRFDTGLRGLKSEEFYRNHFQVKRNAKKGPRRNMPLLMIRDIDQDKKKDVLFVPKTIDTTVEGSKLFCLDNKQREMWSFDPGREMTFGKKTYTSLYFIEGFTLIDLYQDQRPEIIVLSKNQYMFPTQVAVLNPTGNMQREYWNSGRIYDYSFYDLDQDGDKEMLLGGCNNEYDKGFLAVLEADFKSGGSPQTGYYKSAELLQGVEKKYILFPRNVAGKNEYNRGNIIRIYIINDKIISAETKSGLYFEFDFNFVLNEIRFADRYENLHNQAFQKGLTKEPFSPQVTAKLKSELMTQVLYYDGQGWARISVVAQNKDPH
ncbi:MAG: hypothetical protein GF421_00760 [Candidatus Aminicenantes bacterium]|nr:hypothetical protein [Candidatus Aminicenantes bacterium]